MFALCLALRSSAQHAFARSDSVGNDVNNRSASYFIAYALQRCAQCGNLTPVVGLVLPAGHQALEVATDAALGVPAADAWVTVEASAILFDVEYLSDAVAKNLRELSQHYRAHLDETSGRSNWMNHCSFCAAPQADAELYCEPEGAFMPISPAAAAKIRLHEVCEPLEAQACGCAYAPEFLEFAQQVVCAG
jgi:hypothetical protein